MILSTACLLAAVLGAEPEPEVEPDFEFAPSAIEIVTEPDEPEADEPQEVPELMDPQDVPLDMPEARDPQGVPLDGPVSPVGPSPDDIAPESTRLEQALARMQGPITEATGDPDGVPVVVAPFQASNKDGYGLQLLLPWYLETHLSACTGFRLLPAAEVDFQRCGDEGVVDCHFYVAEAAGVDVVVMGRVDTTLEENRITLELLSVDLLQTMGIEVARPVGEELEFAQEVAELVAGFVCSAGDHADKHVKVGDEQAHIDLQAAARELDELSEELGDQGWEVASKVRSWEPQRFTREDLAAEEASDASKPWQRVGMSSAEYLRYRNSGLSLNGWRELASGRQGQMLLRGRLGFVSGPVDGWYHARVALSDTTLQPVETYGFQSLVDGQGGLLGLSAAYGVTSGIEVEVGLSWAWGEFLVEHEQEVTGRDVDPESTPSTFSSRTGQVFGTVNMVLLPSHPVRPLVGAGLALWRGAGVVLDDTDPAAADLPMFPPATLFGPRVVMGGEATLLRKTGWSTGGGSLLRQLDLWVQVPVDLLILGSAAEIYDEQGSWLEDKLTPDDLSRTAISLQVGVQARFLGRVAKHAVGDDEDDEPED